MQAIFIEIGSPGGWVAGFIGVVCLALATYGLGVLPVNWFGIIFLITSFVLFILDVKAPTHGALTAAGIASFIVGALVLFNSPGTPQFQASLSPGGRVGSHGRAFWRDCRLWHPSAAHSRVDGDGIAGGQNGDRRRGPNPMGQVQVGAELWTAEAAEGSGKIRKGDRVEVVEIKGLRLKVRKLQ